MIKNLFLGVLLLIILTSCASYGNMFTANTRIKDVEIDMNKNEVIAIMGKTYEVIGVTEHVEVWGYKTIDEAIYKLYFVDGRLKEWNKEWIINHACPPDNCRQPQVVTGVAPVGNSGLEIHLNAHRNALLNNASSESERQHINTHMDSHTNTMQGR
ncbi:hypothetical protein [Bacteroides sp. 224]|uniref:hypothetical protein n=1 Tax=Bacteroides sp. 224 TaxID=2302936 RepID=UPI0013D86AE5|nr:hypothetical protein [Bacteroides sp. 224]NDV65889.1 hypothetical protein [Bacteroides sp. 224]